MRSAPAHLPVLSGPTYRPAGTPVLPTASGAGPRRATGPAAEFIPPQEPVGEQGTVAPVRSLGHLLRRLLPWPVTEWRYSATGLVGATLGALICFAIMGPERPGGSPPQSSRPGSSCVLLIFVSSLPPDFADDVTRRISRTPVVTGPSQIRAGAIYAHYVLLHIMCVM